MQDRFFVEAVRREEVPHPLTVARLEVMRPAVGPHHNAIELLAEEVATEETQPHSEWSGRLRTRLHAFSSTRSGREGGEGGGVGTGGGSERQSQQVAWRENFDSSFHVSHVGQNF